MTKSYLRLVSALFFSFLLVGCGGFGGGGGGSAQAVKITAEGPYGLGHPTAAFTETSQ